MTFFSIYFFFSISLLSIHRIAVRWLGFRCLWSCKFCTPPPQPCCILHGAALQPQHPELPCSQAALSSLAEGAKEAGLHCPGLETHETSQILGLRKASRESSTVSNRGWSVDACCRLPSAQSSCACIGSSCKPVVNIPQLPQLLSPQPFDSSEHLLLCVLEHIWPWDTGRGTAVKPPARTPLCVRRQSCCTRAWHPLQHSPGERDAGGTLATGAFWGWGGRVPSHRAEQRLVKRSPNKQSQKGSFLEKDLKNNQADTEIRVYFAALTDTTESKQTELEIKPKWEQGEELGWKSSPALVGPEEEAAWCSLATR